MTVVEFQFNFPGGEPIADTEFAIKLAKSGFVPEMDGILMPTDTTFTTDDTGRASVSLAPSDSPYTVRMTNPEEHNLDDSCIRGINYRFYVPISDVPVRAQDLVLNPPPTNLPYDQAAIQVITDAKLSTINAATAAAESAVSAEASTVAIAETAAVVTDTAAAAVQARDSAEVHAQEAIKATELTAVDRESSDVAAQRAETFAEMAQTNSLVFPNTAAGLLSGLLYFAVLSPLESEVYITYENVEGVAVDTGKRTPSAAMVTRPAWSGKKNGWPDTFFRSFDLTSQDFLGADRWWSSTGTASDTMSPLQQGGWSRVRNQFFDGFALRRTANINTTPLNGPVIVLADIDVNVGDTITACQLFAGTGAVLSAYVRFDNGADRGYVGNQIGMTTDAGAGTLTTTGAPQRMKASVVVPAGAKRLMTYAYTPTPDRTFDMLALWSYKGGLAEGPSWPTIYDSAVNDFKVTRLTERMDNTQPATEYLADSYSEVEATGTTITLDGTGFAGFPRNLVFMGWGENYSPSGIKFNALRVKAISRSADATALWKTLKCVVRTGPLPESATGVILAVGQASVLEHKDTLNDVTFILKDPVTGADKTLSDANFTDGKYFIGVWAETAKGLPAACGEPRGVMGNSLLQSFYQQSTSNRPLSGTWNTATPGANNRLAFQHLMLVNPSVRVLFSPSQALATALGAGTPAPEIVLPPYLYGEQGKEINLYFDNITPGDIRQYSVDVNATAGTQLNECLRWVAPGALNAGVVTVNLHDKRSGERLVSSSMQQRAAALSAGAGLTKKCLFFGDSLIAAGVMTQTLLDLSVNDPMKIQLLGTLGSGLNKHEGRGGWSVASYTTSGVVTYQFDVNGVVVAPAINAAEYSHNGAVYRVQETNIVGGAGTITCSVVSGGAPQGAGTLTKTNGAAGDDTINFAASRTLSGNPFWFNGTVDFGRYLTTNAIETPEWVFPGLGTNDMFNATSDGEAVGLADTALARLDLLIASIKAADAGTKVGIIIAPPPSFDQDSFGNNYQTGQNRDRFKRNILIWARQVIAKHRGQEANRVYLVPSNLSLDTVNNMSRAAPATVNSRSTLMVERQDNGVHPSRTGGYQQGSDAIHAFLKWYA